MIPSGRASSATRTPENQQAALHNVYKAIEATFFKLVRQRYLVLPKLWLNRLAMEQARGCFASSLNHHKSHSTLKEVILEQQV